MLSNLKKEIISFALLNGYCPPAILRTKESYSFIDGFMSRMRIKFLKLGLVMEDDLQKYFFENPFECACFFESCAEHLRISTETDWNQRIMDSDDKTRALYEDAIEKWVFAGTFDLRDDPLNLGLQSGYRLKRIRLISEREFKQKIKEIFLRETYVNSFERRSCAWFIDNYTMETVLKIVPETIVRGELRPIAIYHLWKNGCDLKETMKRISHPDDMLRVAVYCSRQTEGEISLSKRLPFQLKRREKKFILTVLEKKKFHLSEYYSKRHLWKVFFRNVWSDAEHELKEVKRVTEALKKGEIRSMGGFKQSEISAIVSNPKVLSFLKISPEIILKLGFLAIKARGEEAFEELQWILKSAIRKLDAIKLLKLFSLLRTNRRIVFRVSGKGKKTKVFFAEKKVWFAGDLTTNNLMKFIKEELENRFSFQFEKKQIVLEKTSKDVFYCLNFIETLKKENRCFVEKVKLKDINHFSFFFRTLDANFSASMIFLSQTIFLKVNEKNPRFLNAGGIETWRKKDQRFFRCWISLYWCRKMRISDVFILAKDWRNGFHYDYKAVELEHELNDMDFQNCKNWFFEKKNLKEERYFVAVDLIRKELTFASGIQKIDPRLLKKFLSLNFDLINAHDFVTLFSSAVKLAAKDDDGDVQLTTFRELSKTLIIKLSSNNANKASY